MPEYMMKILLIEDNPEEARFIRKGLKEASLIPCELIHITNLSLALKRLCQKNIDIILLDLSLPESKGLDGLSKVLTSSPEIPVVVLTNQDQPQFAVEAVKMGAGDHIVKGEVSGAGIYRSISYAIERKRIDRLKRELMAITSHEMRTPLTSVATSLDMILTGMTGEISEKTRKIADIAYRNVRRLMRLVNDLLDIEKLEMGQMDFVLKRQNIIPLVEQAVELSQPSAMQFGVVIHLEQNLHGGSFIANVDRDRFIQVITNLISNALKFSPEHETVIVSITQALGTQQPSSVRVAVSDKGPGIPENFREKVFTKFAQSGQGREKQKGGTGLGLSIAKAMVEKMGGAIGFKTETGVGTNFYVDFPDANATHANAPHANAPHVNAPL